MLVCTDASHATGVTHGGARETMNPYVRLTDAQPVSRRSLLVNAGLAGLTLAGLSACGSSSSTAAEPPASAATGVTAPTADIPVGGGKIFADAQVVVTQPTKGSFKAFSSICTHARCPVADVTTTINCACHGSKFALADGAVVNGPAATPLPARTAKVEGSSVVVSA
ncbi:MAG: iron sulfur protein [Friedmanniella sp.]|nr:iron sulfur protein [Friedmanniella sp.]